MKHDNSIETGRSTDWSSARLSSPRNDSSPQQACATVPDIDFQSAEYNIRDDLDDNIGNYRTFRSLAGVVTADMHHQEKRQARKAGSREARAEGRKAEAKETGTGGGAEVNAAPLSFTVVSRGRTVIIDTDPVRASDCADRLKGRGLSCSLCLPIGHASEAALPCLDGVPLVKVDAVSVKGGFGGFTVMVSLHDDLVELNSLLGMGDGSFDLVLDLQSAPAYAGEQLPLGYYAPGEDASALDAALAELPEMRGRFTKPQFAVFQKNRCFQGRSPARDCLRCQQICPVQAIRTEGRGIVIDPYICQGCGGCALVCPAAAIRLSHPPQEELLTALQALIVDAKAKGTSSPALILYDQQIDSEFLPSVGGCAQAGRIYYGLEEIGRIGLEVLLAALAYGAGSVRIISDSARPAAIREELQRQIQFGATILEGLGLPADRLRFIDRATELRDAARDMPSDSVRSAPPVAPVSPSLFFTPECDKRTLVRRAAQYLSESSGAGHQVIPLPEDAPFGAVKIEASACSLCMACAGACPSGALSASGEVPRLSLVESRCHQCGLCVAACPENAIRMQPRLLCDGEAADAPLVVQEATPFCCIECGAPFASMAMINRMQEKLSGHWMYNSDQQVRRLRMCRTCRTRDALMAKDYQS